MDELDQFQITQHIVDRVLSVIEVGWSELIINYHVEDDQSNFGNSYLISQGGVVRERPLPVANDLDEWLRKLRTHLSQGGKTPFSSCKLHLCVDGRFEATYGYDPVDWNGLILSGWNFASVTSLH